MIYRFDRFQVDDDDFRLSADGSTVPLEPKTLSVLLYLIRNRSRVIRKGEILDGVWKEANVTESTLTRSIGLLRRALGDDSREPRFIETVPTVGFRFIAKVSVAEAPATPQQDEAPTTPAPTSPAPVEASPSAKPQPLLAHPRRWWLLAGLLAGLIFPILLGWFARRQPEATAPIRSLAVLPLENLSCDPDEEYFAQGITEELITDLGYAKSLRVISRASTAGFKNSQLPLPQIAEQLHVDGVIEGTVLRSNNTIRVTIRLMAAKPERQLWAASYERDARDTITLQNQIAAEAVTQIRSQLTPEEQTRLSVKGRVDPEAYDDYLRARFFLDHEPGQKDKAIPHLEHAIQIDPHFAQGRGAWRGMGDAGCLGRNEQPGGIGESTTVLTGGREPRPSFLGSVCIPGAFADAVSQMERRRGRSSAGHRSRSQQSIRSRAPGAAARAEGAS